MFQYIRWEKKAYDFKSQEDVRALGVVQYNEGLAAEITLVPYIIDASPHLCVKTGRIYVS